MTATNPAGTAAKRPLLLPKNGKRLLDLAHLAFAGIWLGAFCVILTCSVAMANGTLDGVAGMAAVGVIQDFAKLCIPALMITGILYGAFTKWGFFKQGWITAKWVLTIIVAASTALVPMRPECLAGVVAGMLALFALSVFKPHGRTRGAGKRAAEVARKAQA